MNRKRKKEICVYVMYLMKAMRKTGLSIIRVESLNRTLDVLQKGVFGKNDRRTDSRREKWRSLIDQVYPCWEEVQKKQYEFIYQALSHGDTSWAFSLNL